MGQATRVVQVAPIGEWVDAYLHEKHNALQLWRQADPLDSLARYGGEATALVTFVRHGCKVELMRHLPALRMIASWGVGYETIDVKAAQERGIRVTSTPGVLDDCVADMAWALMLGAARRIAQGDRYVKGGEWNVIGAFPLTVRVSGKRLGILGLGRIGEAIARRGSGFGMEVRYHNRQMRDEVPYRFESSLVELARWADFLVVACVGGPATRHLVNDEVIRALGPGGILINIARGSVVDQGAMLDALREGRLGGAGLDVLENEPEVPSAFRDMDQVTLMPHTGSATRETRLSMERLVVDNLEAFLAGRPVLTPVTA